jgi:hypothetical protein
MANTGSKERHSYRVSYAYEVGSSFDPDLEDISEWERELDGSLDLLHIKIILKTFSDTGDLPPESTSLPAPRSITPVDLDDAELEAYAEECAKRAALADFEDIPLEDLFSWSDSEELHDCYSLDEDFEMMH